MLRPALDVTPWRLPEAYVETGHHDCAAHETYKHEMHKAQHRRLWRMVLPASVHPVKQRTFHAQYEACQHSLQHLPQRCLLVGLEQRL